MAKSGKPNIPPRQKAASFTVEQIVEKLMPRG
jgi:hypothetical protein